MKRNYKLLSSAFVALSLAVLLPSCIKEEPANAEADITKAQVEVQGADMIFYRESDRELSVPYTEDKIVFRVRPTARVGEFAPVFTLTEGASISPANGSVQDFSRGPVKYTVTSQDKQWTRVYHVSFAPANNDAREEVLYAFEHVRLEQDKYHHWYEIDSDGSELNIWANGNMGFSLTAGSAPASDYPTSSTDAGYRGKGVVLTTRSTGALGALFGKPIAAGNLFTGSFDFSQSFSNPLATTRFGTRVNRIPLRFSGYYKYVPGATLQDQRQQAIAGERDQAVLYAVLYRNQDAEGNAVVLDGSNVQTSPLIVGYANLGFLSEKREWTSFELPFTYTANVDEDALANYGYSLAIVASSSAKGAEFIGAVGSKLSIDELGIKYYKP